jgi:hypothetical protein
MQSFSLTGTGGFQNGRTDRHADDPATPAVHVRLVTIDRGHPSRGAARSATRSRRAYGAFPVWIQQSMVSTPAHLR